MREAAHMNGKLTGKAANLDRPGYKEVAVGLMLAAAIYAVVLIIVLVASLVRTPEMWILTLDVVRAIKFISLPLLYVFFPLYLFHVRFGSLVGWIAQTTASAGLLWLVAWLLARFLRVPVLRLVIAFFLGFWLLSLPVGEFIRLYVFLPMPYDELF
jgi:hypothetical protein